MAIKKPIALYDGHLKELQSGDTLPGAGGTSAILTLQESIPTVPPSVGYAYVYLKPDGLLYLMDANGSESEIIVDVAAEIRAVRDLVCNVVSEMIQIGLPVMSEPLLNLLYNT